jgi:hypothetical protein
MMETDIMVALCRALQMIEDGGVYDLEELFQGEGYTEKEVELLLHYIRGD